MITGDPPRDLCFEDDIDIEPTRGKKIGEIEYSVHAPDEGGYCFVNRVRGAIFSSRIGLAGGFPRLFGDLGQESLGFLHIRGEGWRWTIEEGAGLGGGRDLRYDTCPDEEARTKSPGELFFGWGSTIIVGCHTRLG